MREKKHFFSLGQMNLKISLMRFFVKHLITDLNHQKSRDNQMKEPCNDTHGSTGSPGCGPLSLELSDKAVLLSHRLKELPCLPLLLVSKCFYHSFAQWTYVMVNSCGASATPISWSARPCLAVRAVRLWHSPGMTNWWIFRGGINAIVIDKWIVVSSKM